MRLRRAELSYATWSLARPVPTARGVFAERRSTSLRLVDSEGRVGLGEATPLHPEPAHALEAVSRLEGAELPGSLEAVERLVQELVPGGAPAAAYAVELALLDLLAQARGVPLASALSARARPEVRLSALLLADDPEALAEEAEAAVAQGFGTLKVKLQRASVEGGRDGLRLEAVRRRVGPEVSLRADANGALSEREAERLLAGLAPLDLEVVEQPVAAEAVPALRRLRALGVCPIAADESLASGAGAHAVLLDEGGPAVDAVVLKPTVLGGVLPALRLARSAWELGVRTYVTHAMDGPVARAGAAHLAAALPDDALASGVSFEGQRTGRLAIPSAPGLGLAPGFGGTHG